MRVYAADGERVDAGDLSRPASDRVSVALRGDLEDGPYTATFRVDLGRRSPSVGRVHVHRREGGRHGRRLGGGSDRRGRRRAGDLHRVRRRPRRGYGATALLVGGAVFLVAVWLPARRAGAIGEPAAARFASRARAVGLAAAAAGAAATLAGIVLQGATAAGTSFWSALEPSVIEDVLGTRFGTMWALRLAAFVALGGVARAARRARAVGRGARAGRHGAARAGAHAGAGGPRRRGRLAPARAGGRHPRGRHERLGGRDRAAAAGAARGHACAGPAAALRGAHGRARPLLGARAGGGRGAGGHRHRAVDRPPRFVRRDSPRPRSGGPWWSRRCCWWA